MTTQAMTFDAVAERRPGPKWRARWDRSWPLYREWFCRRGGSLGPSRRESERALAEYLPELVTVHGELSRLAGDGDLASRFLSTWCPPPYLGGCSLAARAHGSEVRLARNYDLSPDLNEGLLLHSEWTGSPVMGMVEFLWGLSDGINGEGLSAALAFGGRLDVARGFGVTTILRYVLETCASVNDALAVLARLPSHMAYNLVLADRYGATASVELQPGGGMQIMPVAIATNHQHGAAPAAGDGFTRTEERRAYLVRMLEDDASLGSLLGAFLDEPLYQRNHAGGFGTLFTAIYDPPAGELTLHWPGQSWAQRLDAFTEGQRVVRFAAAADPDPRQQVAGADPVSAIETAAPYLPETMRAALRDWSAMARGNAPDWNGLSSVFTRYLQEGYDAVPKSSASGPARDAAPDEWSRWQRSTATF